MGKTCSEPQRFARRRRQRHPIGRQTAGFRRFFLVARQFLCKLKIGREGTSGDVANAVLFLATDASAYITGESLEINGGLYFV